MDADERGPPRRFHHGGTETRGKPGRRGFFPPPLLSSGSTAQNHAGPAYLLRKIGSGRGTAWIAPHPSVFRREWTQMTWASETISPRRHRDTEKTGASRST